MVDGTICVIAEIKAKAGMVDELREEALSLVGPTRKEPGCKAYIMHEDADQRGRFVFYEEWESKKMLDAHIARPHLQRFIELSDELFAGDMKVSILKKLS
jgi:quinol monooxygenase YgiN